MLLMHIKSIFFYGILKNNILWFDERPLLLSWQLVFNYLVSVSIVIVDFIHLWLF